MLLEDVVRWDSVKGFNQFHRLSLESSLERNFHLVLWPWLTHSPKMTQLRVWCWFGSLVLAVWVGEVDHKQHVYGTVKYDFYFGQDLLRSKMCSKTVPTWLHLICVSNVLLKMGLKCLGRVNIWDCNSKTLNGKLTKSLHAACHCVFMWIEDQNRKWHRREDPL